MPITMHGNENHIDEISTEFFKVDKETLSLIIDGLKKFPFKNVCDFDPVRVARETLNPQKGLNQANVLMKYTALTNKKVLEIGSGYGMNFIVWTKSFSIDGYGLEPDSVGFESSFKMSRKLVKYNGIDELRIINAVGEAIPFADDLFDIVYSTNALEHTSDPLKVLYEAIRVLKPGGILQIIYPNYHSYFDGHYNIIHPPIITNTFFQWYVKNIFNRDPEFAKTLRTELNVMWTKRSLDILKHTYEYEVLTLGKETFLQRITSLDFDTTGNLLKIKSLLEAIKILKLNILIGKMMILLSAWSPIILTLRKKGAIVEAGKHSGCDCRFN